MMNMDLVYMPFSLILLSSTLISISYGVTTDLQSETQTITDATFDVTPDTTHEATPTTPAVTLNTTKEQITLNTTTKSTTEGSTVSSSIIKLKDERPDYTWIAYVVVGALLLPLAVVSIVNCIRVRRDDTQEKETLDKA